MGEFFRVWKIAKRAYGLERIVHISFDESYIRIYDEGRTVVRVEGSYEDVELMYTTAALWLLRWMHLREKV